jgi:hypothetical protein
MRLTFALISSLVALSSVRADVVINEIMYHPSSENSAEEYVELHNNGTIAENVSGWKFTSGVSFTIPAETSIPPGGHLVVAANAPAFSAKYSTVTNFVAGWTGQLSNSANRLTLVDATGNVRDEVRYADDGDWATRRRDDPPDFGHRGWHWFSQADGLGKSLELIHSAFDNSTGQNWGDSTAVGGTPGVPNSIASADLAPTILEVQHFPLIPRSTDTVTISAKVIDNAPGALTVTLFRRNDGVANFTSVPMFDDGAHDDALAGDGVFGAQITPRADGVIVEYYVTAQDPASNVRTWPKLAVDSDTTVGPFCNALYQVDDAVYSGAMPIYRMIMKEDDRAELAGINQNGGDESHVRFNTTFITVDGSNAELRHLCGARNRGHFSAHLDPQSFNLQIPNDADWNGRVALNFNAQYTYVQLLGSALFRKVGLSAPESRQVQLRLNGVNLTGNETNQPTFGFYVCNEVQNGEFAEHHFPQDDGGNVYSVRRTDDNPYEEGDFTYLPPAGVNGGDPYRRTYFKETNVSEDNWSDLIALTQAMAKGQSTTATAPPTYDPDYVTAVQARVDVDQWMRWFALQSLFANAETNLSNGYGDDFYLYIGVNDPRAQLVPHDLDTILGTGDFPGNVDDGIFEMLVHGSGNYPPNTPTPLNAFMKHPAFAPIYYREMHDLLTNALPVAEFDAFMDQVLSGVVGTTYIDARKSWYAARHAFVTGLIPLTISDLSATVNGGTVSGFPQSTNGTCGLSGRANAIDTRSVKVNGVTAQWSAWNASWSITGVGLTPGINRLVIQAFDENGAERERAYFDVWYNDGSTATAPASIVGNVTWTAAGGPYVLGSDVTIQNGATLTIQPGTSVYFGASGVDLIVAAGGRLLAEGTETSPIRFTRTPGSSSNWGGIVVNGMLPLGAETRIRHAFIEGNDSTAITAENDANIVLDYVEFGNRRRTYVDLDGCSFLISNCIFPTAEPDAYFEGVHGAAAPSPGGRAIVRDCFFGKIHSIPSDYNDVLDFTGGNRPGTIFQFINNVCIGSDDDIVDFDGTDAWIEGNIFMNVHRVGSPDSASAVSGGDDSGDTSEITVVGNLIYNVDHFAMAKLGNFYTLLNNTIIKQTKVGGIDEEAAVINFGDEPSEAGDYGAGMYLEGNIIYDAEELVRNYVPANSLVTWKNNILPAGHAWSGPGSGNVQTEPFLNDPIDLPTPTQENFRYLAPLLREKFGLQTRSPAIGIGPNGTDLGGVRPFGVSVSGAPQGTTNLNTATLIVGTLLTGNGIPTGAEEFPAGSGWTHYQWRLDGGAWSAQTAIGVPVSLAGLSNGTHTVEVIGRNDAGFYQNDPAYGTTGRVASATWTVDSAYVPPAPAPVIRIHEVLAANTATVNFGTAFPDIIELYNAGNATADLAGWGLTDNTTNPYKYAFPAGTTLAPGAYLVVYASGNNSVPQPRTGFGVKQDGDDLTLTRAAAQGGGVVDSVVWGVQLPDYSIGRCADGTWALCTPTFGAPNATAPSAHAEAVKINEWLTDARTLFANDFVELHNPETLPVDVGLCYLTDNPSAWPDRSPIRQLTFIAAGGYLSFKADGDTDQGPDHVDFKLSLLQGEIGFLSPALELIDLVVYGPQTTDISQGRTPNGASSIGFFQQPTPGAPNPGVLGGGQVNTVNLMLANHGWRYRAHSSAAPPNDSQGRPFTHPLYNDTEAALGWLPASGNAAQLFYIETNALANGQGFAKTTVLPGHTTTRPYQTYYFRTKFNYTGPLTGVTLRARIMLDDGAILYLNGNELPRIGVGSGANAYLLQANRTVGDASVETVDLPPNQLVNGENVLAVSVHQFSPDGPQSPTVGSSDVVWGMILDALVAAPTGGGAVVLNEVLPINVSYQNPDGSFAGWIELHNTTAAATDLSDFSLTDAIGSPRKFVFPPGTSIPANGYLTVNCNPFAPVSATNTGFSIDPKGDQIYFFYSLAQGGGLRDSVAFGQQVPDFSLARIANGTGAFALGVPTRSASNTGAVLGAVSSVKLNEWVTNPGAGQPSWFELFNTATQPVLLGGNHFTDQLTNRTKFLVPPLTFVGGSGSSRWLQLIADNDNSALANHVNFTLEAGEGLGLFSNGGTKVDSAPTTAQPVGRSQGRYTDGTSAILTLMPTPGGANVLAITDADGDEMDDNWETANGLNPSDPADGPLDKDGDGQSNAAEYAAGTDPQNPNIALTAKITKTATPGQYAITFIANPGRNYTVRYKTDLTSPNWTKLQDVVGPSIPTVTTVLDTPGNARRFYQVITPARP